MVPGVFGERAIADLGTRGAVALVIVSVIVRPVARHPVVRADRVGAVGPVAGGVVGVRFVGLVGVVRGRDLGFEVIGVVASAIGAGQLRHPVHEVVGEV